MGIVLFIVAALLSFIFALPALLHTIAGAFRYHGKFKYVNGAFFNGAHALDVFANEAYGTFFNDWFILKGGYHFGRKGETLSSAIGKNWVLGKLTFLGTGMAGAINLIDRGTANKGGHCWVYIEGERSKYNLIGVPNPVSWFKTFVFIVFALIMIAISGWLTWWIL
jgi:hypothetical protein